MAKSRIELPFKTGKIKLELRFPGDSAEAIANYKKTTEDEDAVFARIAREPGTPLLDTEKQWAAHFFSAPNLGGELMARLFVLRGLHAEVRRDPIFKEGTTEIERYKDPYVVVNAWFYPGKPSEAVRVPAEVQKSFDEQLEERWWGYAVVAETAWREDKRSVLIHFGSRLNKRPEGEIVELGLGLRAMPNPKVKPKQGGQPTPNFDWDNF